MPETSRMLALSLLSADEIRNLAVDVIDARVPEPQSDMLVEIVQELTERTRDGRVEVRKPEQRDPSSRGARLYRDVAVYRDEQYLRDARPATDSAEAAVRRPR